MFPTATSFIPVTVALARFIYEGGNVFGHYPYWYLGSTPFRYLTGPVAPFVLVLLKSVTGLGFFELSFFLIGFSIFFSSLGWGVFAKTLSGSRRIGVLVFVLSLVLPWQTVSALGLGEVSAVLAQAFCPWLLFVFTKYHVSRIKYQAFMAALFALLLLTNVVASIPTIIGLILLAFILNKHWEQGLKKLAVMLVFGWFLASIWYGLGFWLKVFLAPSFAGKSAASVVFWLLDLFKGLVPFGLALGVVFLGFGRRSKYTKFTLLWFLGFFLLTLFRFSADMDFWMDWTSWFWQLEIGAVLLGAKLVQSEKSIQISKYSLVLVVFFVYLVVGWTYAFSKKGFWFPRTDIGNTVEFKTANQLKNTVGKNETVFLSGSTAFWLNSIVDVQQVRGGADQASVDTAWRKVAWEVREGASAKEAYLGLRQLGVGYLVVHGAGSKEYYHDFSNTEKFEEKNLFEKVYDAEGDVIYRINSVQSLK